MLHARTVQTNLSPGDMSFFPDPAESVQRTFAMLKPDVVNRPWKQVVTQPEPDENGNEVTTEEIRANDASNLQREADGNGGNLCYWFAQCDAICFSLFASTSSWHYICIGVDCGNTQIECNEHI